MKERDLLNQRFNLIKQDKKKNAMNHFRRHTMKTYIKRAKAAKTEDAYITAQKHIDFCSKHNVIHANAAARLKSRLHKCIAAV